MRRFRLAIINHRKAFLPVIAGLMLAGGACRNAAPPGKDTNPGYTAEEFDQIAREIFAPIYPYLARQVKKDYQITRGVAVDAGSGPGYWAIELAKITDLKVYALDLDPEAVKIVRRNAAQAGLDGRIEAVEGNVQKMPFADGFADVVISRGSYLFWTDKVAAFKEIRRILKPGGVAFIGGGLGSLIPDEERTRIRDLMEARKIGPPANLEVSFEEMGRILRKASILEFRIAPDAGCLCGLWVEFRRK
jgi:ubiquinone/menaquinone biosynthesis C-methylase UbiE